MILWVANLSSPSVPYSKLLDIYIQVDISKEFSRCEEIKSHLIISPVSQLPKCSVEISGISHLELYIPLRLQRNEQDGAETC